MANQDPHAKQLLTAYPQDTVAILAPDLVTTYGEVIAIEEVSTEIFNLDPDGRSGFLDVALKCQFADGSEHIVLLVEHWSLARQVNQRRTGRYVFELLCRHPKSVVYPVLLITDPNENAPIDGHERFRYEIAGKTIVDLRFKVQRVDSAWRERTELSQNVVGSVLWVIPQRGSAVDRCLQSLAMLMAMNRAWDKGKLATLLASIEQFARISPQQSTQLHRLIQGDPAMPSMLVELFKADGKAEGKAETLVSLVTEGDLPVSAALARVNQWLAQGDISASLADDIRQQLNTK